MARPLAPPLHVTERIDYALKAVLLLYLHDGEYLATSFIADHYGVSVKMLGDVMAGLRRGGVVASRHGWHGGFRLARPAADISLITVIAVIAGQPVDPPPPQVDPAASRAEGLVSAFWQALDQQVRGTLRALSVADLAVERALSS